MLQFRFNEVLWGTHEVSLHFYEVLPVLYISALILSPSVSQSVSDEPSYRATIAAKKKNSASFYTTELSSKWPSKAKNYRTTKKKGKKVLRAFTPLKKNLHQYLKKKSSSQKFYTTSKNFTPSWIVRIAAYSMSVFSHQISYSQGISPGRVKISLH